MSTTRLFLAILVCVLAWVVEGLDLPLGPGGTYPYTVIPGTTTAATHTYVNSAGTTLATIDGTGSLSVTQPSALYTNNEYNPNALFIKGAQTGNNTLLYMGADSTNSAGYIQVVNAGCCQKPLYLNKRGGAVNTNFNTLDDGAGNMNVLNKITATTASVSSLTTALSVNTVNSYNIPCYIANFYLKPAATAPVTSGATTASLLGYPQDAGVGFYTTSNQLNDCLIWPVGAGANPTGVGTGVVVPAGTYLLFYNPMVASNGGAHTIYWQANGASSFTAAAPQYSCYTTLPEGITNVVVPLVLTTSGTVDLQWRVTGTGGGSTYRVALSGAVNFVRLY